MLDDYSGAWLKITLAIKDAMNDVSAAGVRAFQSGDYVSAKALAERLSALGKLERSIKNVVLEDIWLYELYQTKPHSALDGNTPEEAFKEDDRPLRWAGKEQLDYAFVFTEKRLVDKTGCLSFLIADDILTP